MTKAKNTPAAKLEPSPIKPPMVSKLELLLAKLGHSGGATIDDLVAATGWQKHSVRGAMAGSLKRKGHQIASTKTDGVRRYRLVSSI